MASQVALGRSEFLGIAQAAHAALGVEDDRGRDDRPRQGAAARHDDARDHHSTPANLNSSATA